MSDQDDRFTEAEALTEARTLIRLLGFHIAIKAMDERCVDLRDRMQGNWYLDMRDVRSAMDIVRKEHN